MGAPLPETAADEAAALADDEYRLIAEGLPLMLWRSNIHGKCDYVNPAWLSFRGRTLREELGDGWTDGIHPDDLLHCLGTLVDHFYRRIGFTMEYRLLRGDGIHGRVVDRRAPYFDRHGAFAGFIGTCIDLDDDASHARAVQRSEDGFRVLVEDMAEYVAVTQDGGVVYANPALVRAAGYGRLGDLIGVAWHDLVAPDRRALVAERDESILRIGSAPLSELSLCRTDGREIPVESSARRIMYRGRPAILGILRDVSERKKAEENMLRLTRELNMAEQAERHRLAHDLHDSVSQTLSLVKLELGAAVRALGLDAGGAHALANPLSHLDDAIQQIRSTIFDLYPAMLEDLGLVPTLRMYAEQFEARTQLHVSVSETGPPRTLSTPLSSFLFRAIKELVNNAAKHANATHVVLCLHWQIDRVRVVVDDDGKGFEMTDGLRDHAGAGLGLASIRERTASQAGRFSVESSPGQGTRVVVELPLQ